jgi:hypothetical protein
MIQCHYDKNGYVDPDPDLARSIIIWPAASGSVSVIQDEGSEDPRLDPKEITMDPQH